MITDRFPELARLVDFVAQGTVLDGEILAWDNGPLPFSALQKRIGRKTVSKKLLAEVPVALAAYDVLEWQGARYARFALCPAPRAARIFGPRPAPRRPFACARPNRL